MDSLAIEGLKNNINNYKGVMLCTRPNENIGTAKERPFISRVEPKDQLGVNPVRNVQGRSERKKPNPVLLRHRQWLNEFKQRIAEKKQDEFRKDINDREKFERIRESAVGNRARSQSPSVEAHNETNKSMVVNKVTEKSPKHQSEQVSVAKKAEAPKKKEQNLKPKWAYTEEQVKDEEDREVDDLLDFTNNLDYDQYIHDFEVKNMVVALKKRIDEIQHKEDDWKNKIVDAWNDDSRKSVQVAKVDIGGDDRSDCRSVASESKSVASERTHKSIHELKSKLDNKEKKDWDALSTTTAKKQATIEERIAKHVADEVLRNNTQFRHFHSNASVRRILEKEAQKHLEEAKGIRGPEIVSTKEYFTRKDVKDPNNLPYLHRNPAI
jgi:hypothetical protein